jgi:hypothetical protein
MECANCGGIIQSVDDVEFHKGRCLDYLYVPAEDLADVLKVIGQALSVTAHSPAKCGNRVWERLNRWCAVRKATRK